MKLDVPFGYTTLITLKIILWLESKREISIETLLKHREFILDKALKDYKEDQNDEYYREKTDIWKGIEGFKQLDYNEEINNFIDKHGDVCEIKEAKIFIKEDVEIEDLDRALYREYNSSVRLFDAANSKESYELLGIEKIKKILLNCIAVEFLIEKEYLNLDENYSEERMRYYIAQRRNFIDFLSSLDFQTLTGFSEVYVKQISPSLNNKNKNKNKIFNIKGNNKKDEFLVELLEENFKDYIENRAIFTREFLAPSIIENLIDKKLIDGEIDFNPEDDMEMNIEDNEFDYYEENEEEDSMDVEGAIFSFYMIYISKLKDILEKNPSKNLRYILNRILYVLDREELCLYNEENLDYVIKENINNQDYKNDIKNLYEEEASFLLEQIIEEEVETENTLKKILFISTYYDITKDENIKNILRNNKDKKICDIVTKYIFGEFNRNI